MEDPLAEEMLKGRFVEGSTIHIALDTEKNELAFLDGEVPVSEGEGQVHSE